MDIQTKNQFAIVSVVPCGSKHHAVYFSDYTVILYEPLHGTIISTTRLPESFEEALTRTTAAVADVPR
jgi:hypothetical protein